jgi:hypothetical protein
MSTALFIFFLVACAIGLAMALWPPGPPKE